MHTFVFISGTTASQVKRRLRSGAQVIKRCLPSLSKDIQERYVILPACQAGWLSFTPVRSSGLPYISTVTDHPGYAVVAFGDVLGSACAATAMLHAFERGGAPAVQELEGCYSAVITRKSDGAVFLVGDLLGRRALSYHTDGTVLTASPHELSLLSTGCCSPIFDYASAASVVAVEWSLGRKSLLQDVHTCRSDESLRWLHGDLRRKQLPPVIDPSQRIATNDTEAIARRLDEMVALSRENMRTVTENAPEVKVTLTAGYDSRTALSLTLSEIPPDRILAFCEGASSSTDARVAGRLAQMHDLRFEAVEPPEPAPDAFFTHCDLLAFHMNGATCSKRAARVLPSRTSDSKPLIWGGGGEIYRGFYYPGSPHSPHQALASVDLLHSLKKRTRIDDLLWRSPALRRAVENRLAHRIDQLSEVSEDGHDILDLFYTYERVGVWGAMVPRFTWGDRSWSPFTSTRLLRLGYALPAPIAHYALLHRTLLRRFAPRACWTRINEKGWPPLERPGQIARVLRVADRTLFALARKGGKVMQTMGAEAKPQRLPSGRPRLFAGPLAEPARDLLLSQGSIARELFGTKGTQTLLQEHVAGKGDQQQTLGYLITMERWRNMALQVAREASASTSTPRRKCSVRRISAA